jgi:hypothetical protein
LFQEVTLAHPRLSPKRKTSPSLQRAILHCLCLWHKQREIDSQHFPVHIRQAIQNQSTIGWQDFLEGLLAMDWQRIQQQSYVRKRSRKTGKNWAAGLAVQATRLGIRQWQHRNDYKHRIGRPIDKEHELILNRAIMREIVLGPSTLLPGDKHKVQCNMVKLLPKPLRIRKAWWLQVHTARQRFL